MGQRRQEGRSEDSEKTILLSGKTLDDTVRVRNLGEQLVVKAQVTLSP